MRKIIFALVLVSGFTVSCGNKRVISRSTSKSVASNIHAAPKTTESTDISNSSEGKEKEYDIENNRVEKETELDNYIEETNTYGYVRPRTNPMGASGPGSGGSYASNYYASESLKTKKKLVEKDENLPPKEEKEVFEEYLESDTTQQSQALEEETETENINQDEQSIEEFESDTTNEVSNAEEEFSW